MGCMMGFAIDAPEDRMNAGDSEDTASAKTTFHVVSRRPANRRRATARLSRQLSGLVRRAHEAPPRRGAAVGLEDLTRTWTLQSTTRLNARSTFKAWVPFRVGADQARLCATIDTSAAAAAAATAANEDWRFADEVVITSAWPSITAVSPTR